MSRGDHVDGGLARHVADDSFDSWFAARMNRNRNEERRVSVGGNVSLSDDKPGKESSKIWMECYKSIGFHHFRIISTTMLGH